jgi:N-sulfoglucosamine sulfohydrolase
VMTARTLWPTLTSNLEGLVDSSRTQVYIGRERHVAKARMGELPYPQRAIRTKDYAFIINFKPDRFPLGDHYDLDTNSEPDVDKLTNNTFASLPDEDAGPTKAWIVTNRKDPAVKPFFDHAYGKRPREEFFDLKTDPHQMKNLATDPAYQEIVNDLRARLLNELTTTNDPRLIDNGKFFETPPMAGPVRRVPKRQKR